MRHLTLLVVCLAAAGTGCRRDTPSSPPIQWTTASVEQTRDTLDPAVVQRVSPEQLERFDRVVIEFSTPAVPGYRVAYTDEPARECGSGRDVTVRGASTLVVRLSPAQAHTDEGNATLAWQQRQFAFPTLQEMRQSCDFEGEVSWALGVAGRNGFHVSELTSPARLVIDIQH